MIEGYESRIEEIKQRQAGKQRLRVYFEEWDDPMITAISWVSELIEIAGGRNIFAEKSEGRASAERFVSPEEVIHQDPEVYIGCWCGKPVDMESVKARSGFEKLTALHNN